MWFFFFFFFFFLRSAGVRTMTALCLWVGCMSRTDLDSYIAQLESKIIQKVKFVGFLGVDEVAQLRARPSVTFP